MFRELSTSGICGHLRGFATLLTTLPFILATFDISDHDVDFAPGVNSRSPGFRRPREEHSESLKHFQSFTLSSRIPTDFGKC
ncbi:unnamed protein product [Anisakis simplex]|uniref:Secreted protein n=1 Tax=Anisakis simplex TaxID=6269 RepID=A0A0M3J1A4_ANISI|nr:unnamed protein product [Anisakis simplex]